MCTGLSLTNGNNFYFGRNLDLELDYPTDVVITPRNYGFKFRHVDDMPTHHAMIGMGMVQGGYPLYFEGMNEKGLGMAGLAFWTSCHYFPVTEGKDNVASFELIPYVLGQCETVAQARKLFETINICDDSFAPGMPASPLHWIISDGKETIVVEQTKADGLKVYDDPFDVLTNEPPFPYHRYNASSYCNVCPHIENYDSTRFAKNFPGFIKFGAGMGSHGVPGGLDSISRFIKVAFTRLNSRCADDEQHNVSQFFHILYSVVQTDGSDEVKPDEFEITQYSCCCNMKTLRYYYTTYNNMSLNAVDLFDHDLDADSCTSIPLIKDMQVSVQK